MLKRRVTRSEFLDILKSVARGELDTNIRFPSESPDLFSSDFFELVWAEDYQSTMDLPSVILIESQRMRDFLAWANTYLPYFRPFTSFFHVSDPKIMGAYGKPCPPRLEVTPHAVISLVLAEALTYIDGQEGKRLSPLSCVSTCSFVLGRALACGGRGEDLSRVADSWYRMRSLTKQKELPLPLDDMMFPWTVLSALHSNSNNMRQELMPGVAVLMEACRSISMNGKIEGEAWRSLTRDIPSVRVLHDKMGGRKEDRIVVVERALRAISSAKNPDQILGGFISGYLVSLVSQGSLEHVALIAPFLPVFRSALLWYGLCTGLRPDNLVLKYGDGLGRRVHRDLLQNESAWDKPRCDIAAAELEMLASSALNIGDMRASRSGLLEVELVPRVNTLIRWPPALETDSDKAAPMRQDMQRLAGDIDILVEKASAIRRQLQRFVIASSRRNGRKSD